MSKSKKEPLERLEISEESSLINNKDLFSNHYLEDKISNLDEWEEDEKAKEAFEEIKELYEDKKEIIKTYTNKEHQLEDDFIKPILKKLGHTVGVQETIPDTRGRKPDYIFYRDTDQKREAAKKDNPYKMAVGVGDAKAWNKNLDKKTYRRGKKR